MQPHPSANVIYKYAALKLLTCTIIRHIHNFGANLSYFPRIFLKQMVNFNVDIIVYFYYTKNGQITFGGD
jgi:hypothetical protein